jgi:hypothetical protein
MNCQMCGRAYDCADGEVELSFRHPHYGEETIMLCGQSCLKEWLS